MTSISATKRKQSNQKQSFWCAKGKAFVHFRGCRNPTRISATFKYTKCNLAILTDKCLNISHWREMKVVKMIWERDGVVMI